LLTGVRPYRLKSAASIGMLEQAIATVDVKKPSALLNEDAVGARGTTRESLARQLRGDLDAIALKTLAKEPAERYASAAALAEDLRRYFAGKPIRARRAGLLYRLRKFVRRNKTVVGVTSTAVAAILATIGYALHREAVNQAKIAAKEVAVSAAAQASTQASAELGAPVTAFSPPGHSVAVLPFVDMSERKDQEYFSDGLSEELIDLLARNRNLQVTARTSSFYFKGKQVTIAEIAKTLGVANVLEGSVRKSGNTLRVTAQLIRAADSYHLWSGTYDRNPDDLFKVQDAIAGEVVSALKVLLSPNATSAVADAPSVEANDLYLQATFFRAKGSAAGVNKAGELLARAVAVDPSFAKAWATLSRIKVRQVIDELIPAAGLERARLEGRRAAERAVALAPGLTEPHVALGRVYLLDMDVARAAAEFHRALEIDPRNADATLQLGFIALEHGQIEEQIRMSEQALALDPLDINIMTVLGQAYLNNGDPAPAERVFRRERELAPARKGVDFRLGSALLMLGKPKEALELMENEVGGDDDSRQWVRAMVYPALGRKPQADAIMAALDEDPRTLTPLDIAEAHATRGEIDLAFDWLERQYRTDPKRLSVIFWTSYLLRPLRGDPRYQVLRRRLNLPE
jgi:TolB-like protein/Tfp pilus assembly protein PilF